MPSASPKAAGPNVSRMPVWIRQPLGQGGRYGKTARAVSDQRLHTVCEEARCPNRGECWGRGTATFMLLGDTCTRACGFCSVKTGRPGATDQDEPARVREAVARLDLRYVVLTSVTRDDLPDGGAEVFAATIQALRATIADIKIEVLIPDFQGSMPALEKVLAAEPDILNHNIETVPRLYPKIRPQADYQRSLDLLKQAAVHPIQIPTKSGIMIGLGDFAFLKEFSKAPFNVGEPFFDELIFDVNHRNIISSLCEGLGNAVAHEPCTQDGDVLYIVCFHCVHHRWQVF